MRTRTLLPCLTLVLCAAPARAQSEERFLGTYALVGTYSTGRITAADLAITRDAGGKLTVSRTGRYTSVRYRNLPPFTWTSSEVELVGDALEVTFRIGVDGTSHGGAGITTALNDAAEGRGRPVAAGLELRSAPGGDKPVLATLAADADLKVLRGLDRQGGSGPFAWLEVEASVNGAVQRGFVPAEKVSMSAGVNVLKAAYSLADPRITERLVNTTRLNPEAWWSKLDCAGDRLSSPDPAVDTQRLKLGGSVQVKANGRYTIILPTDGTLTVKLTRGGMRLSDPQGKLLGETPAPPAGAAPAASELRHEVPHTSPALGTYVVVVDPAAEGATLSAGFVQDGKIDPRIRPWSVHTHYPVYEFSYGTSENTNNLYHTGGPLEKFDTALGLTGHQRSVWWEKGTDYRTTFGFERGAYTRISSPTEKAAEQDWFADLNGDGVIEAADVTSVSYFARFDQNADGKIEAAEAAPRFEAGAVEGLWAAYDGNLDGKVDKSEIFEQFVTSYDKDGSGAVEKAEFEAALRQAYKNVLQQRSAATLEAFMRQDADGDGKLSPDEVAPPGAIDFQDSSDVDGDFNSFFDRDNVKVTLQDGTVHFGNRTEQAGGKLKVWKGPRKDQLVTEVDLAQVKRLQTGVADGDLDDSYSVGWWGHCHAWSMASIIYRKPEGELVKNGVTFSVRDQKGILVKFGMGATEDSTFWWQEWGEEIPVARYAAGFHRQLHRWLKVEQKGMMADLDLKNPQNNLNFAVWNYPLLGYEAAMKEAEGDDPRVLDVACVLTKGSYSDDDSSGTTSVSYRLQFDDAGNILDADESKTAWTQKSGDTLEFVRYLIHPYRFTGPGDSRNPNVTEERLQELFGDKLKLNSIEDLAPTDGGLPGTPGH